MKRSDVNGAISWIKGIVCWQLIAGLSLGTALTGVSDETELTGTDSWGGIQPHPAVVNPVCPEADGSVI